MNIKCKAMCVFFNEGTILVQEGIDTHSGSSYYRPLGGSIEFGEYSRETIIREIKEEISAEITLPVFLGVLENVFLFEGEQCHEIIFIYDARFADNRLYNKESIYGLEADGSEIVGVWKKLDQFDSDTRLVPAGLAELLSQGNRARSSV